MAIRNTHRPECSKFGHGNHDRYGLCDAILSCTKFSHLLRFVHWSAPGKAEYRCICGEANEIIDAQVGGHTTPTGSALPVRESFVVSRHFGEKAPA